MFSDCGPASVYGKALPCDVAGVIAQQKCYCRSYVFGVSHAAHRTAVGVILDKYRILVVENSSRSYTVGTYAFAAEV